MVKAQVFTISKLFQGEIKETDLKLQEEELPPIQHGEYLVESLYLSVDPYMRAYARNYSLGQVMIGMQVAQVIESKNDKFRVGEIIVGNLGWRTHTIIKPSDMYDVTIFPDIGDLPVSLALGVLGPTGVSAYFGFLDICKPVKGDTVVVTAAAGAVGSVVGQIALIKGCRVIGITGSEEKAHWLESLGFNYVINYKKTKNLAEDLQKGAPKGIDCYFDNVGGEISTTILQLMNRGGRVSVCGSISTYNSNAPIRAGIVQPYIISNELTLQGFVGRRFKDRWLEAFQQNLQWVREKRLKSRETVTQGFENATKALIGVLRGDNIGKALVKVKESYVEKEALDFHHALSKFKKFQV